MRRSATVKRTFDPQGIFNPGKIVDAPPLTSNLRYGAGIRHADSRRRISTTRNTAAWAAPSTCAAAWAPAARSSTGRCARRTWRRRRKPIPRAAARTCCASRWPAASARRASATRASIRCSISASSAARARRSVRSASTWRGSRASFSPTTGRGMACRAMRGCSGTRARWRSGEARSRRCRTG